MRVFCSICKDIFLPYSDARVTNCGHLYHATCISTWTKQHRTCPQCRSKLSQPIKIFFDVEKDSEADLGVLEHQVETLSDKLRESERSIKSLEEEKVNYMRIIQGIEKNNETLKRKSKIVKESVKALKGKLTSLTVENESIPFLQKNLTELKNKVTTLERIENIIKSSADEVNKMLENTPVTELAVKHLCTYVGILKIQLEKSEAKYIKLDKVFKTLTRNMAEEKKTIADSDLVKSLKSNISKLELQLFQTKALFRDYKRKHPEKAELNTSHKITDQSVMSKVGLVIDVGLTGGTESVECDKSSREVLQQLQKSQILLDELDIITDTDDKESSKTTDFNRTIKHWEELVSAGPSTGLGLLNKSKSFIRSSSFGQANADISRTDSCRYAFDGLGGRKRIRLGGPTPYVEFEMIKKKNSPKVVPFQHKKITDFCQRIE